MTDKNGQMNFTCVNHTITVRLWTCKNYSLYIFFTLTTIKFRLSILVMICELLRVPSKQSLKDHKGYSCVMSMLENHWSTTRMLTFRMVVANQSFTDIYSWGQILPFYRWDIDAATCVSVSHISLTQNPCVNNCVTQSVRVWMTGYSANA